MPAFSLTSSAPYPDVGNAPPSYLAPDLLVRGRIQCRGTVEIDGQMEGDIDANNLIIGPNGHLHAAVAANDTVVSGAFEGVIKSRCVTFTDGCDFDGEVQYEALGMEPHAGVRGSLFPIVNGDARSAVAEQAHKRRHLIRDHALNSRSALIEGTGEHQLPLGALAKPISPVHHSVLGVLVALVVLVAFGAGWMVLNPAARDWQDSLVGSLATPPAAPAPEAPENLTGVSPLLASDGASATAETSTADPSSDGKPVAEPEAATAAAEAGEEKPTAASGAETAPAEAATTAPASTMDGQDPALVLLPPRTVVDGVLLPTEKPQAPEDPVAAAERIAAEKAAAEQAAAEAAAAEKAAAEKAAAEAVAAEKAAAEQAAAEAAAAEKAAAEKAAAEAAAAEKAAAEKAAAEAAAAEKAAAEKAAAEAAAAEKAAAEKAAAEAAAAEKVAAEKAAAEAAAAEKAAAEKAAAEAAAAEKAAAQKAAAERVAAQRAAAEKAAAEKAAAEAAAAEKAAAQKAAAEKAAAEKTSSAPASPRPRRTAPASAGGNQDGGECSWVLQCTGPNDSSCVSVRQCGGS